MNELTTLSTQFEEVVAIVKQIADQTTLLSLNASIEAAQAGDYGRGLVRTNRRITKHRAKAMNSLFVMEEVMRHVIANVSEDATAVHSSCRVPVIEENGVGQLPEWSCENDEECGRHDQAKSVHR